MMARICLAIWDIFMTIVRNMGKFRSLSQKGAGIFAFVLALAIQCLPAAAQKSSDPISTLFRGPGFTTTPAEPPAWVRKSRPSDDKLYERRQIPAGQPDRAAMSSGRCSQGRVRTECPSCSSRPGRWSAFRGSSSQRSGRSASKKGKNPSRLCADLQYWARHNKQKVILTGLRRVSSQYSQPYTKDLVHVGLLPRAAFAALCL